MKNDFERFYDWLRGDYDYETGELTGYYPVDIGEDENNVLVDAELPGFKREEIEISLDDNVLQIKAEREPEEKKGTSHLSERCYRKVERAFTLPATVDKSKVSANLEGGVLHITLPKTTESKPQRIEVK